MSFSKKISEILGIEKVAMLKSLIAEFNVPALNTQGALAASGTTDGKKFGEAQLMDGTAIKYEGDALAVGSAVTLITKDGELPAPDGDLTLADGTALMIKDGKIVEITTPKVESTEPQQPANMSEELAAYPWEQCVADQTARYGDVETAKKVCAAIKNGTVGMRAFVDAKCDIVDLQILLNKEIAKNKTTQEAFNKTTIQLKSLVEIVAQIAEIPTAEPIDQTPKFKKSGKKETDFFSISKK